ncbi:hypothetical protein [Belliella buryatensis]|nr:hypothetical protein [Belliella buryatensis]
MKQISEEDFFQFIDCVSILRKAAKYRDTEDMYNIIEDGSLASESYLETGDYTEEEMEEMESHVDQYYSKWVSLLRRNLQ